MIKQPRTMFVTTLMACTLSLPVPMPAAAADDRAAACNKPIQPCDGAWKIDVVSHEVSGCPSMMAGALKSSTAGLLTMSSSADFEFDTPFHPQPLLARNPDIEWEQTGLDEWSTARFQQGTTTVTADLDVLARDRMQMESIYVMNFPPELAAVLGGGGGDCRSVATVEYRAVNQCGVKQEDEADTASGSPRFADGTPEAKAANAMVEALRRRGLQPPPDSGLDLRDYVTVEQETTEGALYVYLLVANDGDLLPRRDAIARDPCREFEPAANGIRFKAFLLLTEDRDASLLSRKRVTRNGDGKQTSSRYRLEQRYYDTFAQYIDGATNKVQRMQEVKASEQLTLSESLGESWDALGLGPTRLDDGYTDS